MKSKSTKICIFAIAIFWAANLYSIKAAAAGNINAAEQRALSAATQPFEYNGKTYVVNSSYVGQARAKLSAENVDLSDSDADNYISQFNASHQELVEEGYCNEVSSNDSSSTDKSDEKVKNSTSNKKDDKKDNSKDDSKNNTTEKKHSSKTSSINRVFLKQLFGDAKGKAEATKEPQPTSSADVWDEEEDTGTITADIGTEDIDYTYSDALSIKYGGKTYQSSFTFLSDVTKVDLVKAAWKLVIILSVIALISQIVYVAMIKKHGSKKRKLRTAIAVYSGVVIGCTTLLIMSAFVLKFGFLNKSTIDRELMESDYFSGVTQTVREMGKKELKKAGYDEKIADEVFKLSNIYIPEKQYIRNLIENGRDKATLSTDKISSALTQQVTKGSKAENEKIIKKLETIYKLGLSYRFGDGIYKCVREFGNTFVGIMITSIITLLVMLYTLSKMYGFKHKMVRVYSISILLSSVISVIIAMAVNIRNARQSFEISPVFYENFVTKYIAWNEKIGIYIGLIGILIGIALFFVKNYLHRIYVE